MPDTSNHNSSTSNNNNNISKKSIMHLSGQVAVVRVGEPQSSSCPCNGAC